MNSLDSAVDSLKRIVTIVSGLTITNGIVLFLAEDRYTDIRTFRQLEPLSGVFLFLLIINIMRFYHGNMRHLDEAFIKNRGIVQDEDNNVVGKRSLIIDFPVIFVQSLILGSMSFYVNRIEFFYLFIALLFLDIMWFMPTFMGVSKEDFRYYQRWTLNNGGHLFMFMIALFANVADFWLAVIITSNVLFDFILARKLYFPASGEEEQISENQKSTDEKRREKV